MSRKDVPYSVTFCPVCRCPIQRLADKQGHVKGGLQDALEAHARVVHPGEVPEL